MTTESLSIVIPCYRSVRTLPQLMERLAKASSSLVSSGAVGNVEVIFVVDGSPDDTEAVAQKLAAQDSRVRVLTLRRNFGQHNALVAGIRAAEGSLLVTMDDDLQHPPEEISKLLSTLAETQADLVYGVPLEEEHGIFRSASSRLVKRGLAIAGVENASLVGAFRAFRTDLRDGFRESGDHQVNLDVLLSWTTNRVTSCKVQMDQRTEGSSSYNFRRLVRHTLNMVTGYGTLPLRLATWLGFFCGALGVALLVWILVQFAIGVTTVPGFTTLAALISLFSGAQMVTIGVIGEYLGRQHFRSMRRPMYVIRRSADQEPAGATAPRLDESHTDRA